MTPRVYMMVVLVMGATAIGGSFFGRQMVARADLASTPALEKPTTTDPRHPVEVYLAPAFLTSNQAILTALHITVNPEDHVRMNPDPSFGVGGQLVIERALPVKIKDANHVSDYRTWSDTVSQLVEEQNVEPGDKDRVEPALDTKLALDETVVITRVAVVEVTKIETIPFVTKTQDDPNRPKGEKKTLQAGVAGQRKLIYQVTRENGKEVGRKLLSTDILKQPTDEIVSIGTKPVITVECRYNDLVTEAARVNGIDPNALCYRMMHESHGNPASNGGRYKGLFQYEEGFWESVSAKAGHAGASIWDGTAQIEVTAWAWAHGYRGRWPTP